MERLARSLVALDGRGYKAYKEIQGEVFHHPSFELRVDHVQGDPYAAPSRMRARVPLAVAGLPDPALTPGPRRRATRDFIVRVFAEAARGHSDLAIDAGRQTVLDRSACLITEDSVELRFTVDLPAAGRRILGRRARALLCDLTPKVVERATLSRLLGLESLELHCATVEDQTALRASLADHGLVAFVGNGSSLPRRSGIDDRPLENAVPFVAPGSLEIRLESPNAGLLTGLGIPAGVTLIVGGGFHGKSTLLKALESGVWDHIPGDGRELVVTDPSAAKIRAEDGRSVSAVDISPFIRNLPGGTSTESFSTDLASGSTSQAAALVEAMESSSSLLLLDEDTSATNFMIRDRRMQELVARTSEPITPFVDRIGELHNRLGVSTILVMGGSGDYFEYADTVLQMDAYRPVDVTRRAREIAQTHPTGRTEEIERALRPLEPRILEPASLRPERKPGRVKIQARGRDTLIFGRGDVDLRAVEQVADPSQVRAIGWILARLAAAGADPIHPIPAIEQWLAMLEGGRWNELNGRPDGDLALPRLHEVMATLNRIRGVRFTS